MTDRMTVDVWLRGTDFATTATIEGSTQPPGAWTDEDVRLVLEAMLRAMDRVKRPGETDREISLRGLGAAVAGPFEIDKAVLESMIARVLSRASMPSSSTVH
jgi:hypothetical protein